jgi:hypothetical protein
MDGVTARAAYPNGLKIEFTTLIEPVVVSGRRVDSVLVASGFGSRVEFWGGDMGHEAKSLANLFLAVSSTEKNNCVESRLDGASSR